MTFGTGIISLFIGYIQQLTLNKNLVGFDHKAKGMMTVRTNICVCTQRYMLINVYVIVLIYQRDLIHLAAES